MIRSYKSTLQDVPTVIFQMIQAFLSLKDYLSLMNCNKATFADIKYETIVYHITLLGPDEDDSDEGNSMRDFHEDVSMFHLLSTEKVKDKSKQIILDLYVLDFLDVELYIPPFQGIYKLYLNLSYGSEAEKSLDFNMFNNIYEVKLSDFRLVENIVGGFNNVRMLELFSFPKLKSITNINCNRTLYSLDIGSCHVLEELDFPLESVTRFILWDHKPIAFLFQLVKRIPRVKDFLFHVNEETADIFNQGLSSFPIELSLLHKLDLYYPFPSDFQYSTVFENIVDLTLKSNIVEPRPCFNLSRFLGRRLDLDTFDVTPLIERMTNDRDGFKNLRSLKLSHCSGVTRFPLLPELTKLSLCGCNDLKYISSWRKLNQLELGNFDATYAFEMITYDPDAFVNLRSLALSYCRGLTHLPSLPELKELDIQFCNDLKSISSLKKLRYMSIENCKALTAISADQQALRDCGICGSDALADLSFAAREMDMFHLSHCVSVEDVSMLRRVKSLTIICCSKITSLAGLSGDPLSAVPDKRKIILQGMKHVKDLSSLNHIGCLQISNIYDI